jgi:hypothetical protein
MNTESIGIGERPNNYILNAVSFGIKPNICNEYGGRITKYIGT